MKKLLLLLLSVALSTAYGQYCTTGMYSIGCTDGDDINDFTLGSFSQTATGCASGAVGFSDYTSSTITVTQTIPQSLVVTSTYAFGGESIKLFIDYNSDQDFDDPGEEIFVSTATFGGPTPLNASITFPAGSPVGTFRLRAKLVFTTVPSVITGCSSHTYGEIHDYTIQINPNVQGNCTAFSNFTIDSISANAAKVDWTPGTGNTSFYLEYGTTGFTPGTGTKITGSYPGTQPPVVLTGLNPQTSYDIWFGEICNSGADSIYYPIAQDFTTTKLCASPTNLSASNTGPYSTQVSWNQAGSAQEYYVLWGNTGFDPTAGAGNRDTAVSSPYTITGMSPAVVHDIYIVTFCGGGNGLSDTIGPISVTTLCAPINVFPYLETFENLTGTFPSAMYPNCWQDSTTGSLNWQADVGGTTSTNTGPNVDHTTDSTIGVYMYLETSNTGPDAYLQMPELDLTSLTTPVLSFWYHMYGATMGDLEVEASTDTGKSWTLILRLRGQQQTSGTDAWKQASVDITQFKSPLTLLRFRGTRGTDFTGDMAIDDVEVMEGPACPVPSAFTLSTTPSSATFNIIGGGSSYNVEWGPVGFTQGTGCVGTFANGVFTITNSTDPSCINTLASNTTYHLYLRNNCSPNGFSGWVGPISFTTQCFLTAPISQDFESGFTPGASGPGISACFNSVKTADPQWEVEDATGANENSTGTGPFYDNTSYGTAGGHYIYFESNSGSTGAADTLYTAPIDVSALSIPMVSLAYHMYGVDIGTLQIEVLNGSTWDSVTSVSGQQQSAGGDPWFVLRDSLLGLTSDTIQLRIIGSKGGSGAAGDISIDDLQVVETPSCFTPVALGIIGSTTTSATVYWTSGGASNWDVQYGNPGFSVGFGTQVSAVNDTTTLTGLSAGTNYEFYVRDNCGQGNVSTWVGPFQFSTKLCDASQGCIFTADLSDSYGDGWNGAEISFVQNGVVVATIGSSFTTGFDLNNIQVMLCDAYSTDVVLSNAGSYSGEIGFEISSPFPNVVATLASGTTRATGDILATFTASCALPSCPMADSLQANDISDTEVSLEWNHPGGATSYEVWFGPQGFYQGSLTVGGHKTLVTGDSLYMDTLTPGRSYEFLVRAICSPGDTSAWSGTHNFKMLLCDISEACNFVVDLYDTYGDGWNGATISFIQNGVVVQTLGAAFTTGLSLTGLTVSLCDSLPTQVVLSNAGTYPGEIGFEVTSPYNTVEVLHTATSGLVTGNVLGSFNASCTQPTCTAPTALTSSNSTLNSVDLSWTTGGASYWQIEYGPVGFTPGSGTVVSVSSKPHTLTGLTAATSYDIYVRDSCGPGDFSFWTGPLKVSTQVCAAADACGYSIDLLDSYGDGWNSGTISFLQNGIVVQTLGSGFTTGSIMAGVAVNLCDSLPTVVILNNAGSYPGEMGFSLSSPFGLTVGMHVATPGLVSGDTLLVFNSSCAAPTCPPPSNLSTSNVTLTSVDLAWTTGGASNWEVEYGPVGFAPGTGNRVVATTNPFTLTGISAATTYDIYVRDSCAVGDVSMWVGPVTISTPCITVFAPYTEDFETFVVGDFDGLVNCWTFQSNNPGTTPSGGFSWEVRNTPQTTSGTTTGPAGDNTLYPATGGKWIHSDNSGGTSNDSTMFTSPIIDISGLASPELKYHFHNFASPPNSAYRQPLYVDVYDGVTWHNKVHEIDTVFQSATTDPWKDTTLSLAPYSSSGEVQVRFRSKITRSAGGGGDVSIDDISILDANPSGCAAPTNVMVANLGCDTAEITWTSSSSSLSTILEYGPAGHTPGTGTIVPYLGTSYVITGLAPGTAYDFYVADTCGASDTSSYSGPHAFTTASGPLPVASFTPVPVGFSLTVDFDASASTGTDANSTYAWDFGDGNNGTGASTSHTYASGGSYSITLTVTNACGSDDTTITVGDVSLVSNVLNRSLDLYPNPTRDKVKLSFTTQGSGSAAITVTDMTGKEVIIITRTIDTPQFEETLDVSSLADGIYMIRVSDGEHSAIRRLIKE